jgi:ferritin-like metal-binding protein YciE
MASLDEQLTAYLSDAHAIEQQALPQMRAAPDLVGDPELAAAFRDHLAETEGHEELTRARLEARGGSPSRLKEAVFKAGGFAFVLFARSQPDTTGKLVSHALSYEHLELAGYELLQRVAQRAGDTETASVAGAIREQERAILRGSARHAGQAGRVRLCVRVPRGRWLRAAQAGSPADQRPQDRAARRAHRRGGARDGGAARGRVRPRPRRLAGGAGGPRLMRHAPFRV